MRVWAGTASRPLCLFLPLQTVSRNFCFTSFPSLSFPLPFPCFFYSRPSPFPSVISLQHASLYTFCGAIFSFPSCFRILSHSFSPSFSLPLYLFFLALNFMIKWIWTITFLWTQHSFTTFLLIYILKEFLIYIRIRLDIQIRNQFLLVHKHTQTSQARAQYQFLLADFWLVVHPSSLSFWVFIVL